MMCPWLQRISLLFQLHTVAFITLPVHVHSSGSCYSFILPSCSCCSWNLWYVNVWSTQSDLFGQRREAATGGKESFHSFLVKRIVPQFSPSYSINEARFRTDTQLTRRSSASIKQLVDSSRLHVCLCRSEKPPLKVVSAKRSSYSIITITIHSLFQMINVGHQRDNLGGTHKSGNFRVRKLW